MAERRAKFTEGSTLRHVVRMTLAGSLGLTFTFLVDFVTLFWISQTGDPANMAALGFAWTIQFFTISAGVGMAIAATALVSRSIGQRDWAAARGMATAAMSLGVMGLTALALAILALRRPLLALVGAEGETLEVASRFLMVSVPSLPVMALGMVAGSALRAAGDAWRSMAMTLAAGAIALVLDPLMIFDHAVLFYGAVVLPFGAGLGMDGAALVLVASRAGMAGLGLWWVVRVHGLATWPVLALVRAAVRPFLKIALPAMATQMSTPVGNAMVTMVIAGFGDAAVAGWSVVSRLMILTFGGIFALSGAIGGIIGQNHGAGLPDRVASAYRDALAFTLVYVLAAWALLGWSSDAVVAGFAVTGEGVAVVHAFTHLAAGGFVFTGALFVANAAFNNLGRPLWSTAFNWTRDLVLMAPLAWAMAQALHAPGAIYGQALAGVIVGAAAGLAGWRFIAGMRAPALAPAGRGAI